LRPIRTAKPDAATGNPCPICPYAFPANEAAMPRTASVVANPNENAMESPMIWQGKKNSSNDKMREREREREREICHHIVRRRRSKLIYISKKYKETCSTEKHKYQRIFVSCSKA